IIVKSVLQRHLEKGPTQACRAVPKGSWRRQGGKKAMDTDLNPSHTEVAGHAEAAGAASPADIPSDIDVLVVGYGPVGAAIVNLLGLYGVRTLVIDKDKDIFTAPRAIALDNEALRILQMTGLEDGDFDKVA